MAGASFVCECAWEDLLRTHGWDGVDAAEGAGSGSRMSLSLSLSLRCGRDGTAPLCWEGRETGVGAGGGLHRYAGIESVC